MNASKHSLISAILICLFLCATVASQPPLTAEQLVEQGNRLTQRKQFDKAVESYKQAISLNQGFAPGYVGLGIVYVAMGRNGDALEPLKTAASLDPKNLYARLNLGITLMNLRRLDEAMVELLEAKKLAPNDGRIDTTLGNLLSTLGRFDEALAYYKRSSELHPKVPSNFHNIGLTYMKLGKFSEAIEPLETALRLNPKYESARFHLSNAYSKLGRFRDSIDSWTKLMETDPDDDDALIGRALNYMYEGNSGREAALDSQRYLRLYGWRTEASPFQAIIAVLGYRSAGATTEADELLAQAAKRCDPAKWPFNIIKFLGGEINSEELLKLAVDNDKRTEAHTYIGLDLRLKGQNAEARPHFQWVKDYGNKRYVEYPLAVEELKRLSK